MYEDFARILKEKGLKVSDVVKATGLKASMFSDWKAGRYVPKNDKMVKVADFLGVPVTSFADNAGIPIPQSVKDEVKPGSKTDITDLFAGSSGLRVSFRIPVLGRVAAGIPISACEDVLDYEEITEDMRRDGDYFALRIQGDSMEPKISDGDVVIVRQQEDADDGDIVIALVNGDDAVCKRLKKYQDGSVALLSTNPMYGPLFFSRAQIDITPVKIIGKVKELRAKF